LQEIERATMIRLPVLVSTLPRSVVIWRRRRRISSLSTTISTRLSAPPQFVFTDCFSPILQQQQQQQQQQQHRHGCRRPTTTISWVPLNCGTGSSILTLCTTTTAITTTQCTHQSAKSTTSWNDQNAAALGIAVLVTSSTMIMTGILDDDHHSSTGTTTIPTTLLKQYCHCQGYPIRNKKEKEVVNDDDDDLTEHNFDCEDEGMEPSNSTKRPRQPATGSSPIPELIHSLFNLIASVTTTNDDNNDNINPLQKVRDDAKNTKDNDFIEAITTSISSSIHPEVWNELKQQWMNLNQAEEATTTQRSVTRRNSPNDDTDTRFQRIVQCVFNLLLAGTMTNTNTNTNTTTNTNTNTVTEKDEALQDRPMTESLKLAVSDLLDAIQQQQGSSKSNRSDTATITDSNNTSIPTIGDGTDTDTSLFDWFHFLHKYSTELQHMVSQHMSNIDYQRITPTSIVYYTEYATKQYELILQERFKRSTTSTHPWKILFQNWPVQSQEHLDQLLDGYDCLTDTVSNTASINTANTVDAMTTSVDSTILDIIEQNLDAIPLTQLAYADTMDEIQKGLQTLSSDPGGQYHYELIQCDLNSAPAQPAHFYAIRTDRNTGKHDSDTYIDVVVVIRGTKTVADAITDLLCDTQPYHHWGKAHSYILESGRYIANLYKTIFLNLLTSTEKNVSQINVTIYGHSLGAGAGAIAAMELHQFNDPRIQVQMIGYGCPAILSKRLAVQTSDYITTFINDSDLVPRLSGISLTNLLYDIIEFDWMPYAQRDVQNVIKELQDRQPLLFNTDTVALMTNMINPLLESIYHDTYIPSGTIPRFNVELYPPGKCIHISRDESRSGPLACYVPNWFYSQIDVHKNMIDGAYCDVYTCPFCP
jgi:Lipase (class 3)